MSSIFSIDVEDWFHILDVPSAPHLESWVTLPSHVERNFLTLLDLADEYDVTATCFFVGWVAERFPKLVKRALERGHEIASHSYAHRLVHQMTRAEFREDIRRSRAVLQEISGEAVTGFRAPGFSVTEDTPWFFEELASAGYRYDSSVYPGQRYSGGCPRAGTAPYRVPIGSDAFIHEFPATVIRIARYPVSVFGGGYLRISPSPLIRMATHIVEKEGRAAIFYVHPREIDPGHPRLPMSLKRRVMTYINIRTTSRKLRCIFREFSPRSFRDEFPHLCRQPVLLPANEVGMV